jgi:hypothetical protein
VTVESVADRLFTGVMAPLVLGGALTPSRAIGARAALALGATLPTDAELAARVEHARVRRARTLVPIDRLGPPTAAEWALAAALHDLAQSANPAFDAATLRRGAAARIAMLAGATIRRVAPPANLHEALSRHAWLARMLEIARTDTTVSWWSGSRVFLGVEPPARLLAWPELRRVSVSRARRPLLDLAPLVIDRSWLVDGIAEILARSPITDLATCARREPAFAWNETTLALLQRPAGRALAMRVLARLPPSDVDRALGRASRAAIAEHGGLGPTALALLADRAIADAHAGGHVQASAPPSFAAFPTATALATPPAKAEDEAALARALGAAAALRTLASPNVAFSDAERAGLRAALEPAAGQAVALLASLRNL